MHTISNVNTPSLERLLVVGKEQSDNKKICFWAGDACTRCCVTFMHNVLSTVLLSWSQNCWQTAWQEDSVSWCHPIKVLSWKGVVFMIISYLSSRRPGSCINKSSHAFYWSWTSLKPSTWFLGCFFWRFFRKGVLGVNGGTWSVACLARHQLGCYSMGSPVRFYITGVDLGKVTHSLLCFLSLSWMSWIDWLKRRALKGCCSQFPLGIFIIVYPFMPMMWYYFFAQSPQICKWWMHCYSYLAHLQDWEQIFRNAVSLLFNVQMKTWMWFRLIFHV